MNVEMVIYRPSREASEETSPADTLIVDFWPPDCEMMNSVGEVLSGCSAGSLSRLKCSLNNPLSALVSFWNLSKCYTMRTCPL